MTCIDPWAVLAGVCVLSIHTVRGPGLSIAALSCAPTLTALWCAADRMQWPDACAAHAPSPARLIKATLLVLCAMYHATGIGGDDASITFTSFQGSLRDLQACLQTCSEAGLRTTGLVAMTHHLTGTYAHMMNDWAAAHRHYSLALEKCPGAHQRTTSISIDQVRQLGR